jgi:hypothetical protein
MLLKRHSVGFLPFVTVPQLSKTKRRLADEETEKQSCQSRIAVLDTDVAAARAEITSLRGAVAAQDGSLSQLQARVCGLEQQLQVCHSHGKRSASSHFITVLPSLLYCRNNMTRTDAACFRAAKRTTQPKLPLSRRLYPPPPPPPPSSPFFLLLPPLFFIFRLNFCSRVRTSASSDHRRPRCLYQRPGGPSARRRARAAQTAQYGAGAQG